MPMITPIVDFIDTPEAIISEHVLMESINKAFQSLRLDEPYEFTVKFMNDAEIQVLNKDYRGKDKPTNVLSFWTEDDDIYLGDIAISTETILRECEEQEKTPHDHMIHMLVHGFLHLLGYDHEDDGEAEEMEALEVDILKDLGIKNPYL